MNKKNKNKNSRKWLALFLCVAMVATSGVIAVSPGLRAAEDNDVGAASQQTQTEQTVSDQTESGASRHESSSQDKKTGSDEKESSSSQKSDEKASEDKAQTGSSDKTISDDKSGSSEQETEKKSDEKADKDRADNEKTEEKDDKQDADNADEEQTEEVKMPAQSFSGSAGSVTVSVSAPEGALPEDSSMRVTAVSSKTAKSIAKQTASGEVKDAVGVDISFRNADGKETEPARAISVSMSLSSALDGDNFTLSHRSDNGNVTEVSANVGARGAKFSSSSFSIYVIAGEGAVDKPVATYNFHGADGSVIDTQKVKTGDTLNKPESPEKDGYKFTGWSESSEAVKADFSGFGNVTVTEEKTIDLYPVFEEAHYVFFMDSTSSDTARVYETKSGVKGDKIDTDDVRLPLASTENVVGWYDNSSLQGDPVGSYVTLEEKNIYLYPDIQQGHYLYFDTDGGSYIEPQFVSAGKKTVKPDDPERAGYTFEGWTTEEGGNYSFGETITGDVTLKAEWKARNDVEYTIIYWCENANDEKYSFEDFDTKEGKAGDQVDIDSINKPYEGFTLNSKKTNEANAGVTISGDGSTIVNVYFNRNVYDVRFYYRWHELKNLRITAKYGANIADKWPSSTSKIWGTETTGWGGQGAEPYQSGISTMPLDGASFYYVEQSGRYTMNLNYYLEGLDGRYILDHTDSFKSDNDIWSTTKEDHYDIEGFTYTGNVKDGTNFEMSGYATYKVDFKYSRNSYDINFINGSTKTKETFKYGADISGVDLKTAPERPDGVPEGYVFDGWYDNELGSGTPVTLSGTMPASNITLYAKWSAPAVTGTAHLTVDGSGGTVPIDVEYGETIDHSDLPTVKDSSGATVFEGNSTTINIPEGYDWKGWAVKSGDSYKQYNLNTKVYKDIELYPYYVSNGKYTVDYKLGEGSGAAPEDNLNYAEGSYADVRYTDKIKAPDGKVFLYWQSEAGAAYYPGDKIEVSNDNSGDDKVITLTAVYGDVAQNTSLTYVSNYPQGAVDKDGNVLTDKQAYQSVNGTTDLKNNTKATAYSADQAGFSVPLGYEFAGWSDGNKTIDAGDGILIDNAGENILTAIWKPVEKTELTIKPKDVSKTYDGSPLTASEYEITSGTLQAGDTISVTYGGSQTDKGTSASTIASYSINRNGIDVTKILYNVTTVEGSLTVTPKSVTVKADDQKKTYGSNDPELTAEVTGLIGEDTVIYTMSREEGENAGKYAITPSGDKDQGNYTVSYEPGTLTIEKAGTLIVNAAGYNGTYDGESHSASASASVADGTTIYYKAGEDGTWTETAPSITDVGEMTVYVKAVNDNYEDATARTTLKVVPKAVTVTAINNGKTYGDPDPALTAEVTGTLGSDTVTYELNRAPGEAVGSYPVVPAGDSAQGNYSVTFVPGIFTISPSGTMVLSAAGYEGVYDGKSHAVSAQPSVAEGTTISYSVDGGANWTTTAPSIKDVGTQEVKIKAENHNYNTVTQTVTLKVTPAALTVTTYGAEKEYDGKPLTAEGVISGFVNNEAASFTVTGSQTAVGQSSNTYEIVWNGTAVSSNYSISENLGTLRVIRNSAEITVTAKNATKKYDGTELKESGYSVTNLPEGFKAEVMVSGGITNVGTVDNVVKTVVIRDAVGNDVTDQFKTITKNNGTLTVKKRTVTLTSESASKPYDGTALTEPDVTVTGDGFVDGEVSNIRAEGTITKIGSVTNEITYKTSDKFNKDNYEITENEGTLTITANTAAIKVTADSDSKTYDGKELSKNTYSVTGLPDGYKAEAKVIGSITDAGTAKNEVTSVVIKKGDEDVTDQFSNIERADGTLTVNKRVVNLKSESASKPYDGTALTAPEVTVTGDGFVKGEVSDIKATGTITKAGSVRNEITYKENSGFKADNYTISKDEGTLTITQKEDAIVVTAKNASKTYDGTELKESGADVAGLPSGYTADVKVSGGITNAGSAANVVESVVIRNADGTDVTDQFKTIIRNNGTLTVNKRTVTLTSESASKPYDGTALTEPTVTVTGDGFVDGEVSNIRAEGTITEIGSVTNTITYKTSDKFNKDNYEITENEGTLTITANTAAIKVTADSDSKTYDGKELSKNTYSVTGLPDGYKAEAKVIGSITDAGTAKNEVTSVVIKKGDEDVTDQFSNIEKADGTLTVNKRAVNLKSESASKPYDGTALTAPEVTVTGDGFADGEVSDIKATGTITKAGSVRNEITYKENSGFKADNYTISKDEGTLTITQKEDAIVVTAKNASKTYDGTELKESGADVAGLPSGYTADVKVSGSITNAGSAANVVESVVIRDSSGNDVTDQFKTITKNNGTLTVNKRTVNISSASASKEYDGTALTAPTVTVTGDGFVDGEVSNIRAEGTITEIGSVKNTITYKTSDKFNKDNYEITENEGTLTITANTAAIKVTADSDSKTYDGTALTKDSCSVTGLPGGYKAEAKVIGSITDAGTANNVVEKVIIRDAAGRDVTNQFSNIEKADGTLTVNKRAVNLKSESASKPYDGTALTAPEVTVTGDGFVKGEVSDIKATGTITKAGSVRNEITYTENSGFKADNYTISKDEGTLTITQKEDAIVVTAKNASKTYDGTELKESGADVAGLPSGYTADVTVSGSITNAGSAANVVESVVIRDSSGNDVTDQFKTITKNNGTLTVNKRTVNLSSASASKEYDGTALTAPTVTVTGDGFVDGEVSNIRAEGTITEIGSVTNEITYTTSDKFNKDNYEITENEGTLTITANTAAIKVTADSDSKTYDGKELSKNTYSVTGLPDGYTAEIKVSGSITDAGTANNVVEKVIIRDAAGRDVTNQFSNIEKADGTLTVNKRAVNLKSESASKPYDGTALTAPEVTVTGDGFVDGEVSDIKATGTITKAGSVRNEITYKENSGFKADNYTISKDEGTLTITQKEDAIVVTAKNASKTYDGTELKESGADVAGLPIGYKADVKVSGSITNAGSAANVVESVVIRNADGTDVTDQFKTIIRNNGTLTVNKRTVNISSASASKEYDGTALTAPTVTVTGDGFVDGEVSNIRAEGTITEIGSVKNTITYKTSDKFNKDNYDININEGTLTVSPIAYRIIVTAASGTKTYDGTPLEAGAATATGLPAGLTLTADSIGSRTDVGSTETRVNSLTLVIRDSNGRNVTSSYSRYITYRNGEITVTPRNVTLTSGSASKSYDGTPLTNSDMTVGGDGFVKGEGAEYTFTGSQTEVGESANTFRYTLNRNTYAGNYNITTANGTLTVGTPALYTVTIHYQDTDGNALASDYTGQYKEGDSFSIMSPDVQGYTPRTSYVMMPSMPARDVEVTVIYDTSAVPVTPVVPTNPTNPTTPTVPTTPTTPGTSANPTTPSTPATTPGTTTVTTTVIPAVIPGDGITGGGVITTDNDGNDTVTNLDDIKTPEAKKELNELCNILPFLFMLLTLITVLAYTKAMKDDQKKIFELTEELEEKKKNRF